MEDPENFLLNEIPLTEDKCARLHLPGGLEMVKPTEAESGMLGSRGCRRGDGAWLFRGWKFQVCRRMSPGALLSNAATTVNNAARALRKVSTR